MSSGRRVSQPKPLAAVRQDHSATGNAILHLQICTVDVRLGDSGGPIYGNKAMGIVSFVKGASHLDPDWVTRVWDNLMFSQVP